MANRAKGTSRVLSKLKASVEEGNYYEAHQMYKTLYFRYCAQKKFVEVLQLLYEGASLLLSHDQQESGADLALLMLDVLEKSNASPSETNILNVSKLFELMHPSMQERHQYLVRCLKWSSTEERSLGHPTLHRNLAQILRRERNYSSARYHYIRSADGSGCASLLIEFHMVDGYSCEVDLFVAQAVLQYLCLQKKVEACDVFEVYTNTHPNIKGEKGPPFVLPLLNFLWMLLAAIDSGKVSQFTVLCEQYQPSLKRDPMYVEYLDKIGQIFFNLPPPRKAQNSGSFFGNFIQSLLGGSAFEEDSEVSGGNENRPSSSSAPVRSPPLDSDDLD